MIIWTLAIFFSSALIYPCLSQGNVLLERQPWPVAKKCEICVPVQFGKLEMRLPLAIVEKLLVIGSGYSVLHIMPKTDAPKESILLMSVSPEKLIKTYEKSGLLQG